VVLTCNRALRGGITEAAALRSVLLQWLLTFAATTVYSGWVILEWMQHELGRPISPKPYQEMMKPSTAYGGAIEIVAFTFTQHYSVWVWKAVGTVPSTGAGTYTRISPFECPTGIHYQGR
jgi:hypothetical protein|tara:strand:+ start:1233 stop:1592 length:360 start_codon:yes stop_codon:yes gene_type:complete